VDKQHTFLLQKTGNAPIINLTIKPLSSPFRFGSGPIGRQFPGTTGTCDPDYIVADCTFIVSTRARIKGVFSDTIQINYTLEDGSSHTITQELRARYR